MTKAVRITDANVLSKRMLEFGNGCPFNKLTRMYQVVQGSQTIIEGRRPADESHTPG